METNDFVMTEKETITSDGTKTIVRETKPIEPKISTAAVVGGAVLTGLATYGAIKLISAILNTTGPSDTAFGGETFTL